MLQIYKSTDEQLRGLSLLMLEKGAWINLVNPTPDELDAVAAAGNVPVDFLKAALDAEERPRVEVETRCMLVLTDVPVMHGKDSFDTLPLGIILTPDYIMTVCLIHNAAIAEFAPDNARLFCTFKRTRFLFQILYKSATLYLKYVTQLNRLTEDIEQDLRRSLKNREIFQLLAIQKSLTFFSASLKSNGILLQRLLRLRGSRQVQDLFKMYEEDEELLEDVIIENKQAADMVEMYSQILSGMMATFASVISNNINMVMKFLTATTIILAIPTMVSGLFGMNVDIPLHGEGGFVYAVVIALALTALVAIGLWRKGLL